MCIYMHIKSSISALGKVMSRILFGLYAFPYDRTSILKTTNMYINICIYDICICYRFMEIKLFIIFWEVFVFSGMGGGGGGGGGGRRRRTDK